MSNILIGVKRFIKNRNTVTIVAVLACVGILYLFYNSRIKSETDPVSVPYATREIGARTLITSEMVSTRKVPGGVVGKGEVILYTNLIVGKYVVQNAVIPAGSVFYKSMITEDWTEAKESLYEDLPDDYTLVSLPVTLESTYGNSMYPGNYIDLYYVGVQADQLLLGKLIKSIKILGVIDSKGNNVFEKSADDLEAPSYLVFGVPEEYYLLLKKASYLSGTIFPVPRNASYSANPKETEISSTQIQKFILDQTVDVDLQDGKLNPGGVTEYSGNTTEGGE